jgi:hypothetical protein
VGSRRDGKALLPCFVLIERVERSIDQREVYYRMQNIHVDGFDQIVPGFFFRGCSWGCRV